MIKKFLTNMGDRCGNTDFLVVTFATIFSSGISFILSVLARRYVSPLEYGIYSTCLLLQTYMAYGQLGVHNAYNRDYPQLLGAGEKEKARKLLNTAFTFVNGCYMILAIVVSVVLLGLYKTNHLTTEYFVGYLLAMILLFLNTVGDFGISTMRMRGGYNYTALIVIIRSIIGSVLGLIAILSFGYYGLYVIPAVSGIVAILMLFKGVYKDVHLAIDRTLLKDAFVSGSPLMINSFVWTAVASVDKFVILSFMDTEALGIYSVAQLGFSFMVLIPQSMSQVFYIKMSTTYGKNGDKLQLIKIGNRYTLLNSLATSSVCVMGYYLLPIFVRLVMPNYIDGIEAAQIMLIGIAIYGSTMLYGNIFSVLRMNKDLLWTSVALCLFNIVFSVGLVLAFGRHIENVALGTAVSYAAFSALLILKLARNFGVRISEFVVHSWLIIIGIVAPSLILYYLVNNVYIGFITSFIYVLYLLFILYRKRLLQNLK